MPITDIMSYNNVTAPDVITKITKENVLQDSHTEGSLKADVPSFNLKSKGWGLQPLAFLWSYSYA